MSRKTAIVLCVAASSCLPVDARAQCDSVRMPEKSGGGYVSGYQATCHGDNVSELILYQKKYEVTTTTLCKQSGWKSEEVETQILTGAAYGQCGVTGAGTPPVCEPALGAPQDMGWSESEHTHTVTIAQYPANYNTTTHLCEFPNFTITQVSPYSPGCGAELCCQSQNFSDCPAAQGDFNQSECECNFATPILIDLKGNGFQLTSFTDGVLFDFKSNGVLRQVSWSAASSDDAFLVLDRNHNGIVDGGAELFGNYTPVNGKTALNGFLALATFDSNGDHVIDAADPVFRELLLWVDSNHNGRSELSELTPLDRSGITAISVDYRESKRRDKFGNLFRFRASVEGAGGPFAYDINFVLSDPSAAMTRRRQSP